MQSRPVQETQNNTIMDDTVECFGASENSNQHSNDVIELSSPHTVGEPIDVLATNINSTNNQIHSTEQCIECVMKDHLLSEKDEYIKVLRKKLRKANAKIWYLEKTKKKLDKAFSELKQQKVLDEKMCKAVEV